MKERLTVVILALPVCLLHMANKTPPHYDMDLFPVNLLHMGDNQPPRDLCHSERETLDTVEHAPNDAVQFTHADRHSQRRTYKQKGEKKVNQEADRARLFHSDICSVPETDGEPIRPPGASATPRLPCHPSVPPPQPGSWHTRQVAPCKCDTTVAPKHKLCRRYIT